MARNEQPLKDPSRSAARLREYGRTGLFGLLTPQSNPVAEPELRILLPPTTALMAARLTSPSSVLQQRLTDYGERLGEFVEQFGEVAFDAVGFACTGSSYGIDVAEDRRRAEEVAARKGYPVVTAAQAVKAALDTLRVRAIALISPYPDWLTEACRSHWERSGMRVSAILQLPSGPAEAHGIYGLTSTEVLEAVASFDVRGAQAILLTGTGMPSLRVILELEPAYGVPVLSSNLCLAWALGTITAQGGPGPESRLYGGWGARLAHS
jgi:maleate isomerase